MSDKFASDPGGFFAIPGWAIVGLRGRDALAFAQAQFMSDAASLAPGQWHWSGWLTPKGRVIALFALLRLDEATLLLLLADAEPGPFAERLQRFVFRSKVAISVDMDMHVAGAFLQAPGAEPSAIHIDPDSGALLLDLGGEGGPRTLRISASLAPDDPVAAGRWLRFDITHGLPRLDASQMEQWTPQQLSLERLKAYSVKKGCYPGQEIVARTHFLGQAKRGLMRLQGPGVGGLATVMTGGPADPDVTAPRPLGQLVCAAGDEGLAVMPHDAGDGPFAVAGQPALRLSLLDGLAR